MNKEISGNGKLSRRSLLGRIAAPALATAGLGFPAIAAAQATAGKVPQQTNGIFNVRDFGAKGDGMANDTSALQAAIDSCHAANGGTVLLPQGTYLCGTIQLKSFVTLHLGQHAILSGSTRRSDYTAGAGIPPGNGNIVFLFAVNAESIGIEGPGTIDGNGAAFYTGQGDNTGPGPKPAGSAGNFDRPHLAIFFKCRSLKLRDAFFTKSAYHCFRFLQCEGVSIDAVRIYNRVNKNNDGFHFNSCTYVQISNCEVRCQDDACALFGSNQYVTINNCSFSTRWSIFRFGGGSSQNITISNCLIYDTYGCPIKISSGKANIENLSFSNIIMRNVTGPIGIGFSGVSNNNNSTNNNVPSFIRNISFHNIRASVVPKPVNHPDIPFDVKVYDGEVNSCITLNAMNNVYLENISFTDVHVTFPGGGTKEQAAKRIIPTVAAEYFGVWNDAPAGPPAYALFARNVKSLSMHNVRFELSGNDQRPAVILDNVADATFIGFSADAHKDQPMMRMSGCRDIYFSGLRLLSPALSALQLEGAGNKNIILDGGDLGKAKTAITYAYGAVAGAVHYRKA